MHRKYRQIHLYELIRKELRLHLSWKTEALMDGGKKQLCIFDLRKKKKENRRNKTENEKMNSPAQCRYADSGKLERNPPSPELLGPAGGNNLHSSHVQFINCNQPSSVFFYKFWQHLFWLKASKVKPNLRF